MQGELTTSKQASIVPKSTTEDHMATIKTFPELVFITVGDDQDNDFLMASLTKGDALDSADGDEAIVGMYKFVQAEKVKANWTTSRLRNRRTR